MALLSAKAFDFRDGDALHTNGRQGFSHLIELERFDDCRYEFHIVHLSLLTGLQTPGSKPGFSNKFRR
jgi:hypothetical protein